MSLFRRIVIGADHGGYHLKELLKSFVVEELQVYCEDIGSYTDESVDYPEFARLAAEKVSNREFEAGILVCGTGIGMSIVANKFPYVRAALCNDLFTARLSREHNDANILTIGGRIVGSELAKEIVKMWVNTEFLGGRHSRRVDEIVKIDGRWAV
ncbi:MAG: ribose 5-phosphate isomerase B [Thermodesulfobacteriota bacterium]|nr:ribose 5-phosphate isomerase B [Thermodesulfobacteriota bacterium]